MVSMHEIARRLGVKTPSLYNHIKGNKELQYEVFQYAIDKFVNNQQCAVAGLVGDEAVKAFARAYHRFAVENKGLYRLIMSIPSEQDERAKEMAVPLLDTVVTLLSDYILRDVADCLTVFVHASDQQRAERIVEVYGQREESPAQRLHDKDNKRRAYYELYTGMAWGDASNYQLCLDSGKIGIANCVNIIANLYKKK